MSASFAASIQFSVYSQLILGLSCALYICLTTPVMFCLTVSFQAVSREIRKILTERAASFNIALDDVSITSLTFGKEFTAAIEAKQVAAQEAERAKFVVEKAEQDKRSAIIRAQVRWMMINELNTNPSSWGKG